jgi:Spy/CpxP family protein refolding chaperone
MSDTIEKPASSQAGSGSSRRRFLRRAAIVTAIAGVATGLGVKAFAHGLGGWHRGRFLGATLDPARVDEHIDRMLKHLYVEIDATEAQKHQLAPIVKAAAHDMLPFRTQMRAARRQAVELLSRDVVDRIALEGLRADQLRLAEQASQRFTQALADVADVLTPEQRRQLAERVGRWQGERAAPRRAANPRACEFRRRWRGATVCDHGPGIPELQHEAMFQPFHRVTGEGGTGLGLALVRQIARRHGGDARYLGRGPNGSCFVVSLATSRQAATPRAGADRPPR